jgi:transposase-like protein
MVRANRETWIERVAQWKASGVSPEKFAPTIGVNPSTLRWWTKQLTSATEPRERALAHRTAVASPRTSTPVAPLTFVEMTSVLDGERLEVVLTSSVRVRVRPGFDSATLGQLLDVLEGRR